LAISKKNAPKVFSIKQKNGTSFCCSEAFVWHYLSNKLNWSLRCATCAAKKVPENVNEILTEAYLHKVFLAQQHDIPAELHVNTDQTQVVYQ
ncbi:hypothetical protein ARMSODRAFT_896220, partial [Armillaria solidipes]